MVGRAEPRDQYDVFDLILTGKPTHIAEIMVGDP